MSEMTKRRPTTLLRLAANVVVDRVNSLTELDTLPMPTTLKYECRRVAKAQWTRLREDKEYSENEFENIELHHIRNADELSRVFNYPIDEFGLPVPFVMYDNWHVVVSYYQWSDGQHTMNICKTCYSHVENVLEHRDHVGQDAQLDVADQGDAHEKHSHETHSHHQTKRLKLVFTPKIVAPKHRPRRDPAEHATDTHQLLTRLFYVTDRAWSEYVVYLHRHLRYREGSEDDMYYEIIQNATYYCDMCIFQPLYTIYDRNDCFDCHSYRLYRTPIMSADDSINLHAYGESF